MGAVGSTSTCGWPRGPGFAPGWRRAAPRVRRWRLVEGDSVDGGRLAGEESRGRRASRAAPRCRSARHGGRTRVGVWGQSAPGRLRPAGRGAGARSRRSRTRPSPRASCASSEQCWQRHPLYAADPVINYPYYEVQGVLSCGVPTDYAQEVMKLLLRILQQLLIRPKSRPRYLLRVFKNVLHIAQVTTVSSAV